MCRQADTHTTRSVRADSAQRRCLVSCSTDADHICFHRDCCPIRSAMQSGPSPSAHPGSASPSHASRQSRLAKYWSRLVSLLAMSGERYHSWLCRSLLLHSSARMRPNISFLPCRLPVTVRHCLLQLYGGCARLPNGLELRNHCHQCGERHPSASQRRLALLQPAPPKCRS
jgi:hypothetical protein